MRSEIDRLVAAIGGDVGLLPVEIDRVARVGLELLGERGRPSAQLRPDRTSRATDIPG